MLAPLLFLAAITSVTGEWRASADIGHQAVEFGFDLQQSGEALRGTVSMRDELLEITNGGAEGDRVFFSAAIPMEGRLTPIKFTGRLDHDRLRLEVNGVTLTAVRIPRTVDTVRTERLSGLISAWGTIKFFHPYLAYRPIDWDGALMAAIPNVEAAKSSQEYGEAVESMLRHLRDPETQVLRGEPPNAPQSGQQRRLVRCGFFPDVADKPYRWPYYEEWESVDSSPPYMINLQENIRVVMRTGEPATADATILHTEKAYDDSLPSRSQRLLALARYWNVIRYFYGYLDSIPAWKTVLPESIPEFELANTREKYLSAITHLASKTHDSHSFLGSSMGEVWRQLGNMPNVEVWPAEGKSVIKNVGQEVKGIAPGDIIIAVNGEDVERHRQLLLEMYPHSTVQAGLLVTNEFLLAGKEGEVKVRVRKPDGSDADVTLARSGLVVSHPRPVFEILPSGFGYLDLNQLKDEDVARAFDKVMQTPGLILDMRGYPKGDSVPRRLTDKKVAAAAITLRVWHGPDPRMSTLLHETQFVYPSSKRRYQGRVVVLINAQAISSAEHMCLELEAAANPTFIGSPTKGANGTVTNTVLPGNVQVNFCAMEGRHADGRPLQRIGILPQIWVEPTINGIRAGRDEVLDRAVEFLRSGR